MTRNVSDVLDLMRVIIGRRNENDPDSTDDKLLSYLNDFIHLTMTNDFKIFENFGTLEFEIDETVTDGVYTFNDVGASFEFSNISVEGFITLTDPPDESVSWVRLAIFQDPGEFYQYWGVNNTDILVAGFPTQMLYYGTEMVFRTIPDTSYTVKIYGYKIHPEFSSDGDPELPFDYWLRYLAYGSSLNYARDYRYDPQVLSQIERIFNQERNLLLTKTHNQIKTQRAMPRF